MLQISSLEDTDKLLNDLANPNDTFSCHLGEEIKINDGKYNAVWQVAGFDTELGKGGTPLIRHHITLVPKTSITTSAIHNYNIDCNGYANSDMHNIILHDIVKHLENVLGVHLLTRRVKLTNVTRDDGKSSGTGYYSVKVNLMCQQQVYGTVDSNYGNDYDTGEDVTQLPGFATGKVDKNVGTWWWLRDIYGYDGSTYYFSSVDTDGSLYAHDVDGPIGVRPLITIG